MTHDEILEAIMTASTLAALGDVMATAGNDPELAEAEFRRECELMDAEAAAPKAEAPVAAAAPLPAMVASVPVAAAALGARTARRAPNPRTELGNVERFINAAGAELMYTEDLQAWFEWTGVHWVRTSEGRIIELVSETMKHVSDEASTIANDDDRIAFLKFAAASQKKTMISNVAFLAAADSRLRVQSAQLDSDAHLLGVRNGAVDLRTGALIAPDKAARITVVAGAEYDPAASCPLFVQTVLDSQGGDVAMAGFLQRLLGHTLLGNPTEEIMVIPFGNGANGKSTIFGVVRSVLGGYARAADAESFMSDNKGGGNAGRPREDILRLRGARFVYVSEPEERSELKEAFVKAMTGGDAMPARGINAKTTVEVQPTWVPVMPTNHRPIIKGDDFAIWRRIVCVPFLQKFDKSKGQADLNRKEKLLAERAGILNWLVQGALAYQRDGLQVPAAVENAKAEYRRDMDLLGDWLEDGCELDPSYKTASEALYASWASFAMARNELGYIKSQKALATKLANRNNGADFKRVENVLYRGKRTRGFSGLRLKNPALLVTATVASEHASEAEKRQLALHAEWNSHRSGEYVKQRETAAAP